MPRNSSERWEGWRRCPGGIQLRLNVVRLTASGVERPVLAVPGEDLVLLLQLRSGRLDHRPHELAVELLRGEERRHQWRGRLNSTEMDLALALTWSARTGVSSGLVCRVLLDGSELARHTVLLGRPNVDAQGRLPKEPAPSASQATLLAYLEECRREIGDLLSSSG